MTIIGTPEELKMLRNECNGRCACGEWCVFQSFSKNEACPIDSTVDCLSFKTHIVDELNVSFLECE